MRPLDPRLLRYARRAAPWIAALAVLGAVTAGLVIVQAWLLAAVIAGAFTAKPAVAAATLVALAAVVAVRALTAWASEATAHRAGAAAKSSLRRRLLAHVVRLGPPTRRTALPRPAGPDRVPWRSAELTELATTGIDALDGYFTGYLPTMILAVAVPLAVLVTITVADPVSGLTVAVTLPLVPVFGALIGMATSRHAKKRWRALGTLAHHFLDVVAGLPTLKAFGRDRAQRDQIARITDSYRRATMATLRLAFLSSFALELVATMSVALVATEIGLRLAYGHLGLRTGLLVLILAPEAYLPLRAVGAQFHATADGLAAAEDTFAIIEDPGPDRANVTSGQDPAALAIAVERLTVRHEGRAVPAPDGLSLTIEPGRVTVLTGPSGCGKSTLLSVLLGFTVPAAGRVAVTGPGGETRDPALIRNGAGWLPQDPVLFTGTIASNIALGWPGAPAAAIERAAREAALDDVPLERPVGERGAGLSAGQRRRVALARALLIRRPVLLLDEPTAGLDAAREETVLRTLRGYADAGHAVLVVSHHPAVTGIADEVVDVERADVKRTDVKRAGLQRTGAPA